MEVSSLPPPRRRRGLFDATLAVLLLYAVYAKTPCGALPVWAYRVATGQPRPDLLATFRGRETSVDLEMPGVLDEALLASDGFPAHVEDAAKRTGTDPELLVSFLGALQVRCEKEPCAIPAPPHLADLLDIYEPGPKVSLLELARGLERARQEVGGDDELAVEALYVGTARVKRAVEQARTSGLEAPEDVETHAAFLSPGVRRGPLQEALRVLARHRLRTLAWPADETYPITSPFGDRIHPVLKKRRFHNGTDIGMPVGTALFAAHHGRVSRRGRDSVSGKFLKLNLGFDIETTYCHLRRIVVDEGERVARKQKVAEAGDTGRVTGAHLHYILRVSGEPVDPERYGEAPRRQRR